MPMNDTTSDKISRYQVIHLAEILAKWRKTVVRVTSVVLLAAVVIAFLVPREYKSVARVLPPREPNVLSGLTGVSSLVRSLPTSLAKIGQPDEVNDYIAILRSRTVLDSLIRRFDLLRVYDISDSSFEKANKTLRNNTEIDWT